MRFTWDPTKAASNLAKHGVAFEAVEGFEWSEALIIADVRVTYDEPRMKALAPIGDHLYALIFSVERRAVRVISLRKANRREFDQHDAET